MRQFAVDCSKAVPSSCLESHANFKNLSCSGRMGSSLADIWIRSNALLGIIFISTACMHLPVYLGKVNVRSWLDMTSYRHCHYFCSSAFGGVELKKS